MKEELLKWLATTSDVTPWEKDDRTRQLHVNSFAARRRPRARPARTPPRGRRA